MEQLLPLRNCVSHTTRAAAGQLLRQQALEDRVQVQGYETRDRLRDQEHVVQPR